MDTKKERGRLRDQEASKRETHRESEGLRGMRGRG